jgi:hypothetical protein
MLMLVPPIFSVFLQTEFSKISFWCDIDFNQCSHLIDDIDFNQCSHLIDDIDFNQCSHLIDDISFNQCSKLDKIIYKIETQIIYCYI